MLLFEYFLPSVLLFFGKIIYEADEDLCLCPLCLHSMAAHDLESFGLGVAIVHEMKRGNCQDIINYLCTKRGGREKEPRNKNRIYD